MKQAGNKNPSTSPESTTAIHGNKQDPAKQPGVSLHDQRSNRNRKKLDKVAVVTVRIDHAVVLRSQIPTTRKKYSYSMSQERGQTGRFFIISFITVYMFPF